MLVFVLCTPHTRTSTPDPLCTGDDFPVLSLITHALQVGACRQVRTGAP